jgi:hypothetical protein
MLLTLFQLGGFQVPSIPIWSLAWTFLVIGILAIVILILYTKYGRELSIKLTLLSIIFAAVFLGFSIHFFLISFGI